MYAPTSTFAQDLLVEESRMARVRGCLPKIQKTQKTQDFAQTGWWFRMTSSSSTSVTRTVADSDRGVGEREIERRLPASWIRTSKT